MLNKLFITGLFILFACGPGKMASRVEAAPVQCVTISKDALLKDNEKYITNQHWVEVNLRNKFYAALNKKRLEQKLFELTDIKKVLLIEFKTGSIGLVAFDSNDCLIPGSAFIGDNTQQVRAFLKEYDVEGIADLIGTDL